MFRKVMLAAQCCLWDARGGDTAEAREVVSSFASASGCLLTILSVVPRLRRSGGSCPRPALMSHLLIIPYA